MTTNYDICEHVPEAWPLVGSGEAAVDPSLGGAGDVLRGYLTANPLLTGRYRARMGDFWAEGSNGALLIRRMKDLRHVWAVGYAGPTAWAEAYPGHGHIGGDAAEAARAMGVELLDGPHDIETLWDGPVASGVRPSARPRVVEAWTVRILRVRREA